MAVPSVLTLRQGRPSGSADGLPAGPPPDFGDFRLELPIPGKPDSLMAYAWFLTLVALSPGPELPAGQPLPARVKGAGLLDRWEAFIRMHPRYRSPWEAARTGALPYAGFHDCVERILADADARLPTHDGGETFQEVLRTTIESFSGLAPIYHLLRSGATVEPTPALDDWLRHTDIGAEVPVALLRPPSPCTYLVLDREAGVIAGTGRRFEGAYCFEDQLPGGGRSLDIHFLSDSPRMDGKFGFAVQLRVENEQAPLGPLVEEAMARTIPGPGMAQTVDRLKEAVRASMDHLVKAYLYMSLPEARKVVRDERSQWNARLARLGPRKQAKLSRKAAGASCYDRIEIGPEAWPESLSHAHGEGYEVAPHWRRGHFRHQPCGPGNRDRKLIFISPLLVRADRLKEQE